MNKTLFKLVTEVEIPLQIGCGWSATMGTRVEKVGTTLEVSTNQTTARKKEDFGCTFRFSTGFQTDASFDTLGRLIACGAIAQI